MSFIPSKPLEMVPKDKFLELTLRVNPTKGDYKVNSLKRSVQKFSSGTIEELLKWKTELDDVIIGVPISQISGQFNISEHMLMDDSLVKFKKLLQSECHVRGPRLFTVHLAIVTNLASHYYRDL